MDLQKNAFKAAIKAGAPQLGLWCSIPDPGVAEMLAGCGFDWLLFDTEHALMDPISVQPMLQAAAPYPVSAGVRPSSLDPALIKRMLDVGAQTIVVPYVQTPEEAALAVASVTYPPEGIRGVAGTTRATRWGSIPGYAQKAREEIALIVQIETKEALDNLEAIAATPGLDGIFVGPADMAASLGYAGEPAHPEVRAACVDAIRRIRRAGLPAGFLSPNDDLIEEMIGAGSVFTALDIDMGLLRRAAEQRLSVWSDKLVLG